MSYSGDVKREAAAVRLPQSCCVRAFAYGLLQCAHAFTPEDISIQTEHEAVAGAYADALCRLSDSVSFIEQTAPRKNGCYHLVTVADEADRRLILSAFGHTGQERSLRLNRANLECDRCAAAYLRGAFLACGAITDPRVDYHLEFDLPYRLLSMDVLSLLRETGFDARHILRKGSNVLYLKDSDRIADFLTMIGAQGGSLTMYQTVMLKHIRNRVNRQTNCENANIDKTVAAAAQQVEALKRIRRTGGLAQLPPDLQELAALRLEHPEYSLRELGEQLTFPLSRSGVNHRLRRITAWAESLKP